VSIPADYEKGLKADTLFEFPVCYLPSSSYPNFMAQIITVGERMGMLACTIISRRFMKAGLLRWII